RIANRAARFSRILPSNENPLGLQFDTVWNQEQRASGPHDEISGIERGFVIALANNHEIGRTALRGDKGNRLCECRPPFDLLGSALESVAEALFRQFKAFNDIGLVYLPHVDIRKSITFRKIDRDDFRLCGNSDNARIETLG